MNSKRSDTAPLLWLGFILSITLAIAFLMPVTPQDYWWYMRVGRDTLGTGAVPIVDTLTYTQAGMPVVYHSWGAAVLFWLIYKLAGMASVVFLRGLLIAMAYSLLWLTTRRFGAGRLGAALVMLLAVMVSSNNWSVRPQLFAYPLFALALYLLYRWHKRDQRAAWGLPFISLLWVNLHGSFVLLVLLTGAALLFGKGDRRTLALASAGVLLATFINPRGFGSWTYVYNSLNAAPSQIFSREWGPPLNSGWQMNLFFLWLLGFPLLVAASAHKLDRLEWTWFFGFGFMALWGARYVIWFVFILAVFTAFLIVEWERKFIGDPKPGSPLLNGILSVVFVLLPLALLPGVRSTWWASAPEVAEHTPFAATDWLVAHPALPGPLWSEIGFSSYLEFAMPERPTWIDTRFEVFPVSQWQQYRDITLASYNWESQLDATGARILMLSTQYPDLLIALSGSPFWCELYRDDVAVIFQHIPCGGN
jgi:hypothetical protein